MKTKLLTFALALTLGQTAIARNETVKVDQVTASVTLSDDVDYSISSTTPFAVTGSINITNTEHAVIIFENLRPSQALDYLTFITINGEPAVNDQTCQVKMRGSGTIIMPYGANYKPLTVYSEPNFGGESVNDFGLENSGGYMNTLTAAKLNNRIRSFKLKRGYMVTFSNNPSGRGYSRCFIADQEDLEFAELPIELDKKISSYRIFKWSDVSKKGIANTTDYTTTQALNVGWCYSFGPGEDRGIDCECVPHKIQVNWPGNCGTLTYSPHLKTNNEPGNEADHGTESVASVLATWEDLMATGKRLCSPSSHDGSLNWLKEFMDSIDARGWRCDILDMHCYWPEWNLNNALKGYYDQYKRPIWVSEFVWGASWNNNGIFATDRTYSTENQQKNYDVMSKVLSNWNSYGYIERYAYWNSEADCSKIYKDGGLSILGEFYSTMKTGIGYNRSYEFVPKVVIKSPNSFAMEYTERTRTLVLSWQHPNLEFSDSVLLEVKFNDGEWETLRKYTGAELESSSKSYSEIFPEDYERGTYTYRVHNYDIDGQERLTQEIQLSLVSAQGQPGFQYGTLNVADTEEATTEFDALEGGAVPAVFTSMISDNDRNVVPVNTVKSVASNQFTYWAFPWTEGSYNQSITTPETVNFMVLGTGAHQIGDITMEVGQSASRLSQDSTWISFATPFPEGVTPVVIGNVLSTNTGYPYMLRIWGITNKGFAARLERQEAVDQSTPAFIRQYIYYVAATPGTAKMEDGKILTVGRNTETTVDGRLAWPVDFVDEAGEEISLVNPILLLGPQTGNAAWASVFRINRYNTEESTDNPGVTLTTGIRVIRQKDGTTSSTELDVHGDMLGWIAVSDDPDNADGIASATQSPLKVYVRDGHVVVEGADNYQIYAISGQQISRSARLARGIYVVKVGNQATKVLVP